MRWPWRRAGPVEPRLAVSGKALELETAKEILAEVFGARPGRGGGDDPEAAGGERDRGARGRSMAGDVHPERVAELLADLKRPWGNL